MGKTITAVGVVLIALGVGLLLAFELVSGLHSAYYTGGLMWIAVGAITFVIGMKKKERLRTARVKAGSSKYKNALGQ